MDTLHVNYSCISGKVLHQGRCGSCYAISTSDVGAIIKAMYSVDGLYTQLSSQEIVSSQHPGTHGCDGGTFKGAFDYMSTRGLFLGWSYPY